MKKLLLPLVFSVIVFSCKNAGKNNEESESDSPASTEKKISKRDLSITPENAYNDLFLDSMAVVRFIERQQLNDTISRRVRSFYNARNYQFAWFSSEGLTEQARAFWNLHNHYTTYSNDSSFADKRLKRKMASLVLEEELSLKASDTSLLATELKLTQHFIQYATKAFEPGTVKRKEMERFVPRKKEDALYLADSLLTKKHKDNKYFEDINKPYKLLKAELQRYYDIAKAGGWQPVGKLPKLKKGAAAPEVLALKRRLQVTGEMPKGDTTDIFNDTLVGAIKTFQQRFGYTPTGVVTEALVKEMNVPVTERLKQLLINMDRMRWMPSQPEGNLIIVNIPEFVLHVYEGDKRAFDMNVVVGKEGHNSMMFTGNLNQVVFSPYWNIPESIVKSEILPAIERNPNYLAQHNMEIKGTYDEGIPAIRQLPGPDNSLGKVKFLFPNDFDIYFHDTPAKSLFNKDKRAYSHGCIRLSDPVKMANYLLRNNPEWTPEKIDEAMNQETEKYVKLKDAVPVVITYYTAWVDDNGLLNFREDIYGHDKHLMEKMFVSENKPAYLSKATK
ncbi:hypothetical protein EXU57_03815 [Segetibacter sp. 3557_3]|uniref:L,D-transpeptidase family protein n=1 Tax=Segetibacter sp. 3557_3 TaxID=2547429 RepID=UPI00105859AD|nr:L,D-transpeptidase family protein [Segetibacter sp. 3557_3]TDH29205.1 hypothetical protein EXU57_03815 [Segetibacter sp. 3557_3]